MDINCDSEDDSQAQRKTTFGNLLDDNLDKFSHASDLHFPPPKDFVREMKKTSSMHLFPTDFDNAAHKMESENISPTKLHRNKNYLFLMKKAAGKQLALECPKQGKGNSSQQEKEANMEWARLFEADATL
jgi:hypothetical protein